MRAPALTLMDLLTGYRVTQALYVTARLAIADRLAEGPRGSEELARKWIVHDWDDEHSLTLLRNCHRAMAPGARLLLVERVVPERIDPSVDTQSMLLADLNMLVLTGGHERTAAEYRTLLGGAGFALARIVPTATPLSVIEATRE